MSTICSGNRLIVAFAAALAVSNLLAFPTSATAGQKPDVQRLFQAGAYDEAVQAAENADPASTFLAAQALAKSDQPDRANQVFEQLKSAGEGWRLIAESGESLIGNDGSRALNFAKQATEADDDNPFAYYQLGLAASKQGDFGVASRAFGRSIDLKGDFAYSHYYAAIAEQRQRQLSKAAEHFEAFLRLAPQAPERQAVQAIMRTLK